MEVQFRAMPSDAKDEGLTQRLNEAVQRFPTQAAAAEAAGVSLSQMKRYLSGESEIGITPARRLADASNMSLEWLISGRPSQYYGWGDMAKIETAPNADPSALPDEWASIPVYDAWASAGGGALNDCSPDRYFLAAEERWVRSHLRASSKTLSGVYVQGDSMEPTLRNGDIVIVNIALSAPAVDGIYVLRIEDSLLVKRLIRRVDGSVLVRSDNPMYPEEVINPQQVDLHIYGKVVAAIHQM